MKYLYAGDSWASKGFTQQNWNIFSDLPVTGDVRLADFWQIPYQSLFAGGQGNLILLEKIQKLSLPPTTPIVWIYTEPGRDYGKITGNPEFDWIIRDDCFEIRQQLDQQILTLIKQTLPNPIALIGGLSDINQPLAESLGFTVLHPSWQQWIAETLQSTWFKFGWGASDVGWHMHADNIQPGRTTTFAWDQQIKEWCWWEEHGYFCHEHPSPKANKEFAESIAVRFNQWITSI